MSKVTIAASILGADLAYLADECKAVLKAGAGALHLDIMDHHYVPNLSFGADICMAITQAGIEAYKDVHLMVDTPEKYVDAFMRAGANCLTFHPATHHDPAALINTIHDAGMEAGLAFNPDELIDISDKLLGQCDMILTMSVFPGFCGQSFMPEVLNKLSDLKTRCMQLGLSPRLAIDGGINLQTIESAVEAGANYCVIGSGLFGADDYEDRMDDLLKAIDI